MKRAMIEIEKMDGYDEADMHHVEVIHRDVIVGK